MYNYRNLRKEGLGKISNTFIIILSLLLLGTFLITFFYIPISRILQFAFQEEGKFTFSFISTIFTDSLNLKFIGFTFLQALVSTLLCLILGLPLSYFFAKFSFKGKNIVLNLLTIPFVLPPIVVLLGFIISYGEGGWINSIWYYITNSSTPILQIFGTFEGILIAHVFYNLSVVIRITKNGWENIDRDLVEISETLGVNKWRIFWKVIIPQILNHIISAALLVFIYTFNSFAIVLYLGEVRLQTLEVRIYKLMNDSLKIPLGAALAFIQLLINTFIIISYLYFEKKSRTMGRGKEKSIDVENLVFKKGNWKGNLWKIFMIFYLLVIGFFTFSPIFAVIIQSFIPYSDTSNFLWGYQQLISNERISLLNNSPLRLVLNTLIFALLATTITLIISLMIVFVLRNRFQRIRKYRSVIFDNLFSYLIILPMATSSISLAIGLFLNFGNSEIYYNSVWIFIVLAHVLISVPFATRSILSAYNRIDVELLNVASTLGATRFRIFRKIEFPLIFKGILVGGIFSFAISLGEFGATNFLVKDEYGTLSIGISKLLFTQTLQLPTSMATIMILLTIICFLLIQKLGDVELKV